MRKLPNTQILQERYFTTRDLRETLRELGLGVDNAEFARLWKEGVVTPPVILEPEYTGWDFASAKQLIVDFYNLKGLAEKYDTYKVDEIFVRRKELKRYKKEMNEQYFRRGKLNPY